MPPVSRREFLNVASVGAAGSILGCSCTSSSTPTVFLADKAAYICGCKPEVHNPGGGGERVLYTGNYCRNSERFLLHWNLSGIASGVQVSQALMGLYCVEIYGTPSGRLVYAPLLSEWGDEITFATQPPANTQEQVRAAWPEKGQWQEVDVTRWVNRWLATPEKNFGVLGYAVDVSEDTCSAVFASVLSVAEQRPRLTLAYSRS